MKCVDVTLRFAGETRDACKARARAVALACPAGVPTMLTLRRAGAGPAFVMFAITLISGVIYTWSLPRDASNAQQQPSLPAPSRCHCMRARAHELLICMV
jgi:hypothetical protein